MTQTGNLLIYLYLRYVRRITTPRRLLDFACRQFGSRPALTDGHRTFTLAELNVAASRLANALLSGGLLPGQTLAVLLRNSPEFIITRMAAYKAGLVFSPLVDDFDFQTRIDILNEVEAAAFIFDDRIGPEQMTRITADTNIRICLAAAQLATFAQSAPPVPPAVPVRAGDIASIGFTSGTTGRSKGVVWTNRAWLASFYHLLLNRDDASVSQPVILHTLPFSTTGSLGILPGLASGTLNVVRPCFEPREALAAIRTHRVTRMLTVPVFLMDLWEEYLANESAHDLNSLQTITIGSAPMPGARLGEIIRKVGPIVEQGYGMSEVLAPLARVRVTDPDRQAELLRSAGRPIPQVRLKIVEPDADGQGRVAIQSPSMALEYWKRPDLTAAAFRDGWFVSNDIGRIGADGHLFLLGRTTEVLERNGHRIFARDTEERIVSFPGVRECVVLFRDGRLIAIVIPRRNAEIRESAVREHCAAALRPEQLPDKVITLDRLPRSTSGKPLKRDIEQTIAAS